MDLELLQVRTVDTVLKMIVDGLVEKVGFALARIWARRYFARPVPWAVSAPRASAVCTWSAGRS